MPTTPWLSTATLVGGVLIAVAAIMLVVWARGRQWRNRKTICIACGHSRNTLAADARCVECGRDVPAARRHCRSRRRRFLLPCVLLLILGGAIASAEWVLPRLPRWLPDRLLVAGEPLAERLGRRGRGFLGESPPWGVELRDRLANHSLDTPFSRAAAVSLASRWLDSRAVTWIRPLDELVHVPTSWPEGEPLRVIFGPPELLQSVLVRTSSAVVLRTTDGTVLAHREVWPPYPSSIWPSYSPFEFTGRIEDLSVEVPASALNENSVVLNVAIVEIDQWPRLDLPPPEEAILASRAIERTLPHPQPWHDIDKAVSDPTVDALLATAIRACLSVGESTEWPVGCLQILVDFDRVPGSMCFGLDVSIAWLGSEVSVGPLIPYRAYDDWKAVGTATVDLSVWNESPHRQLLASEEHWPADVPRPRLIVRGDRRLALRTFDRIREFFPRVWTGTVDVPLLRCNEDDDLTGGWHGCR